MKQKTIWVIVTVSVCFIFVWLFRFELMFYFQCRRLQSMHCAVAGSCLDKIWAHRVNTLERFRIVNKQFRGVEADIVFDTAANRFWIYHPPLTEKVKLPLDVYLKEVLLSGKNNCWLDTRYVDQDNVVAASAVLKAMDTIYHIKDKTIFELYNVSAANYLAEQGFRVSMNIPGKIFADTAALHHFKNNLSPAIRFVSQESSFVTQLEQQFPGKQILTWSISFKNYFNRQQLVRIAGDPRVAVILVNIKSRYYR